MMDFYTVGIHFLLAAALFFIVNWIGSHSLSLGYMPLSLFLKPDEAPAFNLIFRVLTPVVYIVVVSAGLYLVGLDRVTRNIYLVVVYYFAFRLTVNVATGCSRLLNWRMQVIYITLSSILSYLAYKYVIIQRTHLLPDFTSMANELWLVIFGFVYLLFNRIRLPTSGVERRKRDYLQHRYELYRRKYGQLIVSKTQDKKIEALIYAVMIYEAFNRPKAYRLLEIAIFPLGLSKTLGIMQVKTRSYISDRESVALGAEIIVGEYLNANHDESLRRETERIVGRIGDGGSDLVRTLHERSVIKRVLKRYNPSDLYTIEVERLHEAILRAFYPTEVGGTLAPAAG